MAYIMMADFVKARLRSPSTADFPGVFDGRGDHVKRVEGQTYMIVSWVDSQNAFGATIRTEFIGKITQYERGKWKLEELEFFTR